MYRLAGVLLFGLPAANMISDLVASVAKVDGRSMQPTFNPDPENQDFILINKLDKYNVSRGDIIVMISPKDPEVRLVKRVTALEGDVVIRDAGTIRHVSIPNGYIWVEGDQPCKSMDSNSFGPVPLGLVLAKVMCIIWPLNRIQILTNNVNAKI